MKVNVILLSLLYLVITACSFTTDKSDPDSPRDWVNGQRKEFAHALYLSGQGSALTRDDAKDRARSDLAKQFEVALKEHGQQSQTYMSKLVNGETVQSLSQKVSRQLLSYTSRTLQGVEIVDQWYDKNRGLYHALAVLSRNRAQHQFRQELQTLDQQSQQRLRQADAETSPLIKAALVHQAIDAQKQRRIVQSSLQVVDFSGRGQPASLSLPELIRSRDTLLKDIDIIPAATGEMSSELVKILSGASAGAGFSIAKTNNADYWLRVQTLLDPVFEQNGWYWLRGTLQINLSDASGSDVGVQRWPLKASSINIERTQQRLLSEVDKLLKNELRNVLLGFALKP